MKISQVSVQSYTRKAQASLHLYSAQEMDHLQSFNHSPSDIQSLIADYPCISKIRYSYSNGNDFLCV